MGKETGLWYTLNVTPKAATVIARALFFVFLILPLGESTFEWTGFPFPPHPPNSVVIVADFCTGQHKAAKCLSLGVRVTQHRGLRSLISQTVSSTPVTKVPR